MTLILTEVVVLGTLQGQPHSRRPEAWVSLTRRAVAEEDPFSGLVPSATVLFSGPARPWILVSRRQAAQQGHR